MNSSIHNPRHAYDLHEPPPRRGLSPDPAIAFIAATSRRLPRPRRRPRRPARRQPDPGPRGPPPPRPGRRAASRAMGRGFRVRPLDRRRAAGGRRHPGLAGVPRPPTLAPDDPPSGSTGSAVDRRLEQTRGDVAALPRARRRVAPESCSRPVPNRRLLELIASLRQVPRRYLAAYMRDAGRLSLSTLPPPEDPGGTRGSGCDSARQRPAAVARSRRAGGAGRRARDRERTAMKPPADIRRARPLAGRHPRLRAAAPT